MPKILAMYKVISQAVEHLKRATRKVISRTNRKYISLRLKEIFLLSDYDAVELLIGFAAILWGFWVGNPYWDAFAIAPHAQFVEVAPEWFWGTFVGILGGIHIASTTVNVNYFRKRVAFLSFCTWLFVLLTFGWQRIFGPATSLYLTITVAQAWVYLRYASRQTIDKKVLEVMLREEDDCADYIKEKQ